MPRIRSRRRITVSLEESAFKSISRIAEESDVSIAWTIRYAVNNLLKEWKEGEHPPPILNPGRLREE
ncbi:MAG: ribbon-helix-helix protein, CopG family [Proteobacteria bacterium]|nr:ribbon-helix-helix protein, CopG family [Pseudomonadota bacterium]